MELVVKSFRLELAIVAQLQSSPVDVNSPQALHIM
jgi:hypothetical protein